MELEEYVQMKDMFRSQREEAEREFELARAEEEEMSKINFKSTFFLGHPVYFWKFPVDFLDFKHFTFCIFTYITDRFDSYISFSSDI